MRASGRIDTCHCGQPAFFHNSQCVACGTALGFDPERALVLPLENLAGSPVWKSSDGKRYYRCSNFSLGGCNWLVPASSESADPGSEPKSAFCQACALNRTIPDTSLPVNAERWRRMESAKRRMVASLLKLNLPLQSKIENPEAGLAFDFLAPIEGGPSVTTGHAAGVITLNIEEADDVGREAIRAKLHEPYRTLLGHFRHEVGHYYWDRLIAGSPLQTPFRGLFGDEREDYSAALARHYQQGPRPDWPDSFISAYATSHPWEDWAETWAHYLHMVDTFDAAWRCGIRLDTTRVHVDKFQEGDLYEAEGTGPSFLSLVNDWVRLTVILNELSENMGLKPFYPFVLAKPVVKKLHFVHLAIDQAAVQPNRQAA